MPAVSQGLLVHHREQKHLSSSCPFLVGVRFFHWEAVRFVYDKLRHPTKRACVRCTYPCQSLLFLRFAFVICALSAPRFCFSPICALLLRSVCGLAVFRLLYRATAREGKQCVVLEKGKGVEGGGRSGEGAQGSFRSRDFLGGDLFRQNPLAVGGTTARAEPMHDPP
jgi:hypothetical protein